MASIGQEIDSSISESNILQYGRRSPKPAAKTPDQNELLRPSSHPETDEPGSTSAETEYQHGDHAKPVSKRSTRGATESYSQDTTPGTSSGSRAASALVHQPEDPPSSSLASRFLWERNERAPKTNIAKSYRGAKQKPMGTRGSRGSERTSQLSGKHESDDLQLNNEDIMSENFSMPDMEARDSDDSDDLRDSENSSSSDEDDNASIYIKFRDPDTIDSKGRFLSPIAESVWGSMKARMEEYWSPIGPSTPKRGATASGTGISASFCSPTRMGIRETSSSCTIIAHLSTIQA
ncbi:hypothetical protein M406DRAFT_75471 [Cryphonectria parasitica EP155]|uniref:Uncharacterized protein n=1 Tax=Cryphonectria parasitica (strain ATCC 38755 / EP155) TaxID=660469 RepID=A0A9P4Y7R6_CRYP1|nr:uncharacterized protein M406DRAFT_75471 [Cryphonectria parasitica EP155]KAF3768286.1 hypothetical protein M406DRAFT_75471 [Cryphonectria parasitica EP155]